MSFTDKLLKKVAAEMTYRPGQPNSGPMKGASASQMVQAQATKQQAQMQGGAMAQMATPAPQAANPAAGAQAGANMGQPLPQPGAMMGMMDPLEQENMRLQKMLENIQLRTQIAEGQHTLKDAISGKTQETKSDPKASKGAEAAVKPATAKKGSKPETKPKKAVGSDPKAKDQKSAKKPAANPTLSKDVAAKAIKKPDPKAAKPKEKK